MGCCKDCKDRVPNPNCHSTCERYLKEFEERKELNEKQREERSIISTIIGNNIRRARSRSNNKILSTYISHRSP